MSFRNYYDSSYGRSRVDSSVGRSVSSISTNKPTAVTAKYINPTSSYKSSSIPIPCRDRSATRETESPITAIANRYANYKIKDDKATSKYTDKKDSYNKLTVPTVTTNRSRDVSPVSASSKYSLNRSSRHRSPERRIIATSSLAKGRSRDPSPTDRDKDIPKKTDKSSSYNTLSSYKLYPRSSSYSRPASRAEVKPEITVNRYAIANRLATNYLRAPSTEKTRTSLSPVNHDSIPKIELDKTVDDKLIIEKDVVNNNESEKLKETAEIRLENGIIDENDDDDNNLETVVVVTRHTSPTPPGSSAYVRSRRADMAKILEKTITRPKRKSEMVDKEIQSDRLDDPTRTSRFGSTARAITPSWSIYGPNVTSYTGYAGRFSTQYNNIRENSVSSSTSEKIENIQTDYVNNDDESINTNFDNNSEQTEKEEVVKNNNSEVGSIHHSENKDDDNSEIVINVNLKLKKAKTPSTVISSDLVSPEVTITNCQLPPQAPKAESTTKTKKKVRKSSTDSSSDSSKKKIVKKRSKSISSTESDQGSDTNNKTKDKSSVSPPKVLSRNSSSSNLQNSSFTHKHSTKSRESNSPESSITLSTQSSISEDETISKSKTIDLSRTSAEEVSIPLDRHPKQSSPMETQRNETGAEEAKSFLIRALAPVTNLFKMRHTDSTENNTCLDSSTSESTGKDLSNLTTESDRSSKSKNNTENIIASNHDNLIKLKGIRRIDSGERAWWQDPDTERKNNTASISKQNSPSDKNIPKKITHIESGERAWWLESNSEKKIENQSVEAMDSSNKQLKKCNFVSLDKEEKPWWLDSSANIPEGIERLTPPRKTSSDSDKSDKFDFYKVRHIESGEKDWWLTSNENTSSITKDTQSKSLSKSGSDQRSFPLRRIRHVESGERPWWLSSSKNIPEGIEKLPTPPPQADSDSSVSDEVEEYMPQKPQIPPFPLNLQDDEPLGDRRSPEGLETPRENENYDGRDSPYENSNQYRRIYNKNKLPEKFISRYTDIDDIIGTCGQIYSPFMNSILALRTGQMPYDNDLSECKEIDPTQVRIHDSTAQRPVIKKSRCRSEIVDYHEESELDDAALQVFKDGDYGPYLDLDSTLGEQEEEMEGVQDSRKNSIVLRTQLSVRVHAIIEKLLHSQGRELRRALFTLKQILQSDKDLVHEFVNNKGLDCLMQVSNMADHNYLDYILRALGQILLYVDGMHGFMSHKQCTQWLYSLIASKYRHVVKNALKLLLVFVEYTDENSLLLINAIHAVDVGNGVAPWFNVMKILQDLDTSDTELLIYATTLINRCLNNVTDRDVYYDQVDALHGQGMDEYIQRYMTKQGTDLDLLRQLQIFEAVLLYEDGDESSLEQLDDSIINMIRRRNLDVNKSDKRKSKKQQLKEKETSRPVNDKQVVENTPPGNTYRPQHNVTSSLNDSKDKELSAALRRRRDRCARQAHHILQQQEMLNNSIGAQNTVIGSVNGTYAKANGSNKPHGNELNNSFSKDDGNSYINRTMRNLNIAEVLVNGNQRYTSGLKQRIQNGTLGHSVNAMDALAAIRQKQSDDVSPDTKEDRGIKLDKEHSIKDLAQKLTTPVSPTNEDKPTRVSDMAGIVSKAKEELAKSHTKEVIIKSPTIEIVPKVPEIKVSEADLYWEELKKECMKRDYILCDMDFSDLKNESDEDFMTFTVNSSGVPPPPPPALFPLSGAPPPPPSLFSLNRNGNGIPKPPPKMSQSSELSNDSDSSTIKKNKKTVKLFWREIQDHPLPLSMRGKNSEFIWDELPDVKLDTKMLEHLFQSKSNDLMLKKMSEPKRNLILSTKRSNAINIGMKKLPTPQTIKAAIMKMETSVIGREGIDQLMTMLPTEEEKLKIQEAQYANPDLPLGSAEQFLLTLASISELTSRLKLWVFKLDFDNSEKEIAEPLMDLKISLDELKKNKTFKVFLATLRSVGSFLNGNQVKGFRVDYLSKVMEVKDTVHKHPLLYHLCEMIIEKFPESTDLYSELGPLVRAALVDYDAIHANINKLETDCKASWGHIKKISKHDSSQTFKVKINEFLTNAAERIILLGIIRKKVMCRYHRFLLYLGLPPPELEKTKPSVFLKLISDFTLEYRTSRERVLQQMEKRANHRERNKTRGKMITDVVNYTTKNGEISADTALKELLKADPDSNSLANGRKKIMPSPTPFISSDFTGDDAIIESLVRSATSAKRRPLKERKRSRISDNIDLNRTLDGHRSWPSRENGPR